MLSQPHTASYDYLSVTDSLVNILSCLCPTQRGHSDLHLLTLSDTSVGLNIFITVGDRGEYVMLLCN